MIHNNSLSDIERIDYLKNSSGEAEQLLLNIPPTSDNFARAWEILTDQYQNLKSKFKNSIECAYGFPL